MDSSADSPAMRRHIPLILFVFLLISHGVANGVWIGRDRTLRANDMGPHLAGATSAVSLVGRQGLSGLAEVARGRSPVRWPSAAYLPWVPPALVLGGRVHQLRLYNLGFLALLLGSVFVIGRRVHSPAAGLLAAALLSLYPVVYGESRQFQMDLPGAAMLCLSLVFLLKNQRFTDIAHTSLFGLATAGAMLVRPQSVFVLALPALLELGRGLRRPPAGMSRRRVLLGGVAAAALVLAGTAVWWWGRVDIIGEAFFAHQQGHGFAAEGSSLLFYRGALAKAVSPLLLIAASVAALFGGWAWIRGRSAFPDRTLTLWVWLLGGLAALSLLQVHMLRYLLPILPALALLTAIGLLCAPRGLLRPVIASVLLLAAALFWLSDSFALRLTPSVGCAPVGPDRIDRAEPYVTAGPPATTPLYLVLEQALGVIRKRHNGSGKGVLVRLENRDKIDDLRIRWMGVPLVLGELDGACVTERELDFFILDPAADEVFHWAPVPYPQPAATIRHCYGLRLQTAPVPSPPRHPDIEVLARIPMHEPLSRLGPSMLTLLTYKTCREPGREPDRPPPEH